MSEAWKRYRDLPCICILTDTDGHILRIEECDTLLRRYEFHGMLDAALQGSGKSIFVAEAPSDRMMRLWVEASLVSRSKPEFGASSMTVAPSLAEMLFGKIEHQGDVPSGLA